MVLFENCTKVQAFHALWKNSKYLGMGRLHNDGKDLTKDEIEDYLSNDIYVDYYKGKVMKINFSSWPDISPHGYNRDIGQGAMEAVADILKNNPNEGSIQFVKEDKPSDQEIINDAKGKIQIVNLDELINTKNPQ